MVEYKVQKPSQSNTLSQFCCISKIPLGTFNQTYVWVITQLTNVKMPNMDLIIRTDDWRRLARSVAKVSLVFSLTTLCLAILLPFLCFHPINDKDQDNGAVFTYIENSCCSFFTLHSNMMSKDKFPRKAAPTSALLLAIAVFLLAAIDSYSAVLLLKGTKKNLQATHAIKLVRAHQCIQNVLDYARFFVILILISAATLHNLLGLESFEILLYVYFIRFCCLLAATIYEMGLEDVIRKSK